MAFKQLKDLIQWITEYHEKLERQYQDLAGAQDDERVRMALRFLAGREKHLAEMMGEFLRDADRDLMSGWLVDSQDFDIRKIPSHLPACGGCHDIQDVLKNILQANTDLTAKYEQRARLAQNRREAELFRDLAASQQAEARLQSRDIGRLQMY
jgi:DNA-binding ferritin-like protein